MTVNLKTLPTTGELNENSQNINMKLAFAKPHEEGYETITEFFKCRDYLSDMFVATLLRGRFEDIYGLDYDGDENPICLDKVYLALKLGEPEKAALLSCAPLFNDIPGTNVEIMLSDDPELVMVEASPIFLQTTQHISLLTLLVRIMCLDERRADTLEEHLRAVVSIGSSEEKTLRGADLNMTNMLLKQYKSLIGKLFVDNTQAAHNLAVDVFSKTMGGADSQDDNESMHNMGGIYSLMQYMQDKGNYSSVFMKDYMKGVCSLYNLI